MINNFKGFIEMALNKNQMGKPSPSEFNSAMAEAEIKIYSGLFSDFRKLNYRKSRFQDTPNYGNEAEYLKQAQEYYIKEERVDIDANGIVQLPKDFFLFNSAYSDKTEVEKVDLHIFNKLKRLKNVIPTSCSPILTLNDGEMKIHPEHSAVDLSYFRKLKLPKWTYRIVSGIEVYDNTQSDFQDIDVHPLMYHKLFVDVLALLGLNIKEEHALQYTSQLKQENIANGM